MPAKVFTSALSHEPIPLPQLEARVAVLGGGENDKTAVLVGLAVRQVQRHGVVLCLDARRYRPTEVQFRLLLRGSSPYFPLPSPGEVPAEVVQVVLGTVSRGLMGGGELPPLLLLDSVRKTQEWGQTLSFLLKAGTIVIELLRSPTELVFGRYDTVLLLRSQPDQAEALSRAVGRKVSPDDLEHLPAGEGVLIRFAQVQRVLLPGGVT